MTICLIAKHLVFEFRIFQLSMLGSNWPSKLQKLAIIKNRSTLAVNCWVIIHCLEVSCKEDQTMSAQHEWQQTDKQWILLNNLRNRADLFPFEHTINDENTFALFSFLQFSAIALRKSRQYLDCIVYIYMYKLRLSSVKTTLHSLTPWLTSFCSNKWRQLARVILALSKLWIIVWYITFF